MAKRSVVPDQNCCRIQYKHPKIFELRKACSSPRIPGKEVEGGVTRDDERRTNSRTDGETDGRRTRVRSLVVAWG